MSAWEPNDADLSRAHIAGLTSHGDGMHDALLAGAGPTIAARDWEIERLRFVRGEKWVETRIVRFDDAVLFGHGGFDFDAWENLRMEMHTIDAGSYAVWPSSKIGGRRAWSFYGGPNGQFALDRYYSEDEARTEAEMYAESIGASALIAGASPAIAALTAQNARLRAVIKQIKDALEAIQSEFKLDGDLSDIVDAAVEAALVGDAA